MALLLVAILCALPSLASAQTAVLLPVGGDPDLVAARGTEALSRVREDLESDGFALLDGEALASALSAAHAEPCAEPTCAGPMLTALHAAFAVGVALWPRDGVAQVAVSLIGPDGIEVSATSNGPDTTITQLARSALSQARANWSSRTGSPIRVLGSPEGASISIDHSPVGSIPYEGHLSPGTHHFVVSAEGHASERRDVEVAAATTPIDIRFELPLGSDEHHDDHGPNTSTGPDLGWIIGGSVVLAGGLALAGIGIANIVDNERGVSGCTGAVADRVIHHPAADAGVGLLIGGSVAVVLGVFGIVLGVSASSSSRVALTSDGLVLRF